MTTMAPSPPKPRSGDWAGGAGSRVRAPLEAEVQSSCPKIEHQSLHLEVRILSTQPSSPLIFMVFVDDHMRFEL